jgi:hypothetical protein
MLPDIRPKELTKELSWCSPQTIIKRDLELKIYKWLF